VIWGKDKTGVIMLEYINQLRSRGYTIEDAAVEGAVLRLRPIMMTMPVATLGLLPAALSHGIGSDSQRPFVIVIVLAIICQRLKAKRANKNENVRVNDWHRMQ
jgi:cobalt-zinc-cadmium resistance protein CzcA